MRDFSFLKLPRNATEAFRTKTYSGVLCALEERSCNTAFALQGPEAVKTKQKRNQTLDWRGHTTARKNEVGRSGRGIQGKWEGGWMHASGGRAGTGPRFSLPIHAWHFHLQTVPRIPTPPTFLSKHPSPGTHRGRWFLYSQRVGKAKDFSITQLSGALS